MTTNQLTDVQRLFICKSSCITTDMVDHILYYFVACSRTDDIVLLAWLLPDLKMNEWYRFHVPVYPLETTFTIGITADDNDT